MSGIENPPQKIEANELPQHLRATVGITQGLGGIEKSDLIIPRLKLIQNSNPEVLAKTADPGCFLNSMTGNVMVPPETKVNIVPILSFKEWLRWAPRVTQQGVIDRTRDPKNPVAIRAKEIMDLARKKKWKENNEQETFVEYINIVVVFPDSPSELFLLQGCKTQHACAGTFLTQVMGRGQIYPFAGIYSISTFQKPKQSYRFWLWGTQPAGWTSPALFNQLESAFKNFDAGAVSADYEPPGEDAGVGGDLDKKEF